MSDDTNVANSDNLDDNNKNTALVPIDQRQVDFYGDSITAALVKSGGDDVDETVIYVPIRPLCEYLGLGFSPQLQRIKRDSVMRDALTSVIIMNTEVGQRYSVQCLQLDVLPGWLFGITTSKVRKELQGKIERYRRYCFKVLVW
jgi:hypothetical protein